MRETVWFLVQEEAVWFLVQWRPGVILTGAINHSCGVLHGSYKKSLPCSVPQELFCMVKMRYFRGTGPKVSFTLDVIWGHMGALFCNWKWIKWFRRLFKYIDRPRPSKKNFMGVYRRWRFLTVTACAISLWLYYLPASAKCHCGQPTQYQQLNSQIRHNNYLVSLKADPNRP
jgi:hypothetical protein